MFRTSPYPSEASNNLKPFNGYTAYTAKKKNPTWISSKSKPPAYVQGRALVMLFHSFLKAPFSHLPEIPFMDTENLKLSLFDCACLGH